MAGDAARGLAAADMGLLAEALDDLKSQENLEMSNPNPPIPGKFELVFCPKSLNTRKILGKGEPLEMLLQ